MGGVDSVGRFGSAHGKHPARNLVLLFGGQDANGSESLLEKLSH